VKAMSRLIIIESSDRTQQGAQSTIGLRCAGGLGTAVGAAARGYRTLLLEAFDFAKGTSSRSTKLVHGGVRYLVQGNTGLVFGALRERGILQRNAPHLVHRLPFVVPAYDWWSRPFYGAGLLLYSLLAGSLGMGFSRVVSRDQALRLAPTLEPIGLRGGVVYYDGQFDDSRMAIALLRTLQDPGGLALNYAPVTSLIKEHERIAGVVAHDAETGQEMRVRARAVVNATGVFADDLRHMDDPQATPLIAPSQGVHIGQMHAITAALAEALTPEAVAAVIVTHDRAVLRAYADGVCLLSDDRCSA
jgi:glycerol-3-phosphate dehydrogenase